MIDRTMQDHPVTDEVLVALADGELGAAEAATLRARIAADPKLAERFALFAETHALFAPERAEDLDDRTGLDRLAAAIHAADRALAARAQEEPKSRARFSVIEGGGAPAPTPARPPVRFRAAAPAMAASIALIVGGALGYGLGRGGATDPGAGGAVVAVANAPGASAAVAAALERSPSGQPVDWRDDASGLAGSLTVISSHRVEDGRYCREYEASVAGVDDKAVGVGCRGADGRWSTDVVARVASGDGSYGVASGASVAENAITALGGSGALDAAEEKTLIGAGWAPR